MPILYNLKGLDESILLLLINYNEMLLQLLLYIDANGIRILPIPLWHIYISLYICLCPCLLYIGLL